MLGHTFLSKPSKTKIYLLPAFLMTCVVGMGNMAFANQEVPDVIMPEIIVTGVAEPSDVKSIPATVQVITREDIDKTGATTLATMLERVLPGTFQPQNGGLISVGMRGFRDNSSQGSTWNDGVLTLIDGNRTNVGNVSLMPLGNVERIEIVRGPSSVIYGASAMGGVINIITKRGKGKASGKIGAEYGSFDSYQGTASFSGALGEEDGLGYALAVQRSHTGDYEDGNGNTVVNTRSNNIAVSATATIRPDDQTIMSFVLNHASYFNTGSPGDLNYPATPNDNVNSLTSYGAFDFSRTLDNDVYINTSLYATRTNYTYNSPPTYTSDVDSSQVGARTLVGIPVMDFGRIAVGGEYSHTTQENSALFSGFPSNQAPNGSYDALGLFAEYKVDIGSLALQTGLRYDNFDTETIPTVGVANVVGSRSFDQISWQAGATYWVLDWLGVRVATGTSFTPPAPHQLSGNYNSFGFTPYVGNPNLNPESAWSSEIGIEIDYAPFSATVAYFNTDLDDRISTALTNNPAVLGQRTSINAGKERIAGFETLLKIDYIWVATDALNVQFVPYINAEYFTTRDDYDNPAFIVAKIPEYNATYGLGIGFNAPVPIWFDINARTTGSQDTGVPQGKMLESFTVMNLRLSVDPMEDLSVYFEINNIGDRYYSYIDGYPMQGRSFTAGIEYSF